MQKFDAALSMTENDAITITILQLLFFFLFFCVSEKQPTCHYYNDSYPKVKLYFTIAVLFVCVCACTTHIETPCTRFVRKNAPRFGMFCFGFVCLPQKELRSKQISNRLYSSLLHIAYIYRLVVNLHWTDTVYTGC